MPTQIPPEILKHWQNGHKIEAIKQLRENMPAMLEYAALQGKIAKARYDALVSAGFSIEQAMRLCTQPINL